MFCHHAHGFVIVKSLEKKKKLSLIPKVCRIWVRSIGASHTCSSLCTMLRLMGIERWVCVTEGLLDWKIWGLRYDSALMDQLLLAKVIKRRRMGNWVLGWVR